MAFVIIKFINFINLNNGARKPAGVRGKDTAKGSYEIAAVDLDVIRGVLNNKPLRINKRTKEAKGFFIQ